MSMRLPRFFLHFERRPRRSSNATQTNRATNISFRIFFIHREVAKRNSTELCRVFISEPHLKINVKNVGFPLKCVAQKTAYFW